MNQLADLVLLPFVLPAGLVLKAVRRIGLRRLRWCSKLLLRIGVLPIRRHYYEPFIDPGELRRPLDEERRLPGIDWNCPRNCSCWKHCATRGS